MDHDPTVAACSILKFSEGLFDSPDSDNVTWQRWVQIDDLPREPRQKFHAENAHIPRKNHKISHEARND